MSKSKKTFFKVPSEVFSYELNPYELAVLFCLCKHADNKSHTCWPSENSIAKECGMGYSTVRKAINSLKNKKIISAKSQYKKSVNNLARQTSNCYTILFFDEIEEMSSHSTPPATIEQDPCYVVAPPLLCGSGEINKTKTNITISNITTSTELKSSAMEEDESASLFLKLKEKCLLELQNEYALDEDKIDLVDRALYGLWERNELSYEGRVYSNEELKKAILERLSSGVVVTALSYLENASEPIRLPVAYLSNVF